MILVVNFDGVMLFAILQLCKLYLQGENLHKWEFSRKKMRQHLPSQNSPMRYTSSFDMRLPSC